MGKDFYCSGYCCPYDKLPCKRISYSSDMPSCLFYGVTGRLKFVCRRYVAPIDFTVPKQLSPELMKDISEGSDGFLGR